MDKAASRKRGIVFRVLTVFALVLLGAAYFQPGWWVSLTAPNYPEATFPQGIRILFHMDSVRNGCDIRASQEVEETEALDCVHEMDTINHYVGMYPIASGGPVEKAFSPFLFAMIGVMALAFITPGRWPRVAVSLVGYGAVAAWMTMAVYGEDGVGLHTTGYLKGLVVSLGQDETEDVSDQNLSPIVRMLKESLAESAAEETETLAVTDDRAALMANIKANFENDQAKLAAAEREAWTGSLMQVFRWHYAKSLARWFNEPERNDPLVATMTTVAKVLYWAVLAVMLFATFAALSAGRIFYWVLILVPMAVPIGFLAEYAGWLWWYGHSLNAMGAFTLKPFMPTVFGDGKVAQFTTHSYPAIGFGLMVAASALFALAALIRRKQLKLAGDAAAAM